MSAADTVIAAPAETETPLEAARALRWTSFTIAVITALLFVFNTASLRSWADGLAPNETTLAIRDAADAWDDTAHALGLAAPRDAVHVLWKSLEAAKF